MPKLINFDQCAVGNRAMASVLLLYYHLAREGGITHDQTVYLTQEDFDPFAFLDVQVAEDQKSEIDQSLLREGAVVYLLCELNDQVGDYEADFLKQPFVQKILEALAASGKAAVPEVLAIVQELSLGEQRLNYASFRGSLTAIYEKYVNRRFKELPGAREA
jgi:hypothetical protein